MRHTIALALALATPACVVDLDDLPDLPAPCRGDVDCDGRCAGERVCTHDCSLDEHCEAGQTCIAGSCYVGCSGDDDCDDGLSCVGGVCGFESLECGSDSDCGSGQVCSAQRLCSNVCDSQDDCPVGWHCSGDNGYCGIPCTTDDDCDELAPGASCPAPDQACTYGVS